MTVKWALASALIALAALPASAAAQAQFDYPAGNDYLTSDLFFSTPSNPPPRNEPLGLVVRDTTQYTTQDDLASPPGQPGSSGIAEPISCPARFGHTFWSFFYSPHYGRLDVRTAGNFDSVIGIAPFQDLDHALPVAYDCSNSIPGFEEHIRELIGPKSWYAIQVGGTGNPGVGTVQVKVTYLPPPRVDGQAFLFWKTGPLRITDMYVKSVPKGEKITLSCTKHSCSKRSIPVRSKAGLPAAAMVRAVVHEAKAKVQVLKNRKVKASSKIELRITRPAYIGKYYVWTVSRKGISAARTLCMNPGSSKPRKKCTG
jgi:hypothetical protein